jgi:putative tryptophan/tyrosine transport system substrate-binding protein
MKRREFLGVLSGMAAAWPVPALGQQTERMRRVAILMGLREDDPEVVLRIAAFRERLHKLGWSEGKNLQLDFRWDAGEAVRAKSLAAELVSLHPDAILAQSTVIAIALQKTTSTIPIVFVQVVDPIGSGLVTSLSHPNGNVTGLTHFESSMSGKWISLLKELAPGLSRVGVLFNPQTLPIYTFYIEHLRATGPTLGVEVVPLPFLEAAEIERTLSSFKNESKNGLLVLADNATSKNRAAIIRTAAQLNLPAIYPFTYFARDGGLISYGIAPLEIMAQAAGYIDKILRGSSPSDLPVQAPTKFELVINLKAAKALGLIVPNSMQLLADEVIE